MKESIFFVLLVTVIAVLNFMWVDMKYEREGIAHSQKEDIIKNVKIAGKDIRVDLARTPDAHAKGLSDHLSLGEEEGMLFVFQDDAPHLFWMKDMKFPIDIIWIDKEGIVIYTKEKVGPETFPEVFGPEESSRYVLEVVSGFVEKYQVKKGDGVEFTY